MRRKSLLNKTFEGFFWVFSGTATKTITKLIFLAIMARLLFPEDFGLVASIGIIVSFAENLNRAGIVPSLVNLKKINRDHISTAFTLSLALGVTFYSAVFILSPVLGAFFNAASEFVLASRIMGIQFILTALSRVSDAMLQRNLEFRKINIIQIISFLMGYILVGLIFGFLNFGFWSLIIAELSQKSLYTLLIFVSYKHSLRLKIEKNALKEIIHYGGGFTLGKIIDYFANKGDDMVIARMLGTVSLGFYTRAFQLMSVPVEILNQLFERVLFPVMSRVNNDPQRLGNIYLKNISFIFLISLPFSLMLFILAPEIIRAALGPNWEESIIVLQILSVGMVFRSGYKVSESLANAQGAVYRKAARQLIFAISVFLFGGFGHFWGLVGVSVGILIAFIINFILMLYLSFSLVPIRFIDILNSIKPSIFLTTFSGIPLYLFTAIMRSFEVYFLLTLTIAGTFELLLLITLARIKPDLFLGRDGIWVAYKISKKVRLEGFVQRCLVNGKHKGVNN